MRRTAETSASASELIMHCSVCHLLVYTPPPKRASVSMTGPFSYGCLPMWWDAKERRSLASQEELQ